MKKIKTFRIFSNDNKESKTIKSIVQKKLQNSGFLSVLDGYDLAIAIGGDGSFLRMIKKTNFNSNVLYIGINTGTLGFAQEVSIQNIDCFIEDLKNGQYKVDEIGIQETKIVTNQNVTNFYSLNEIVLREKDLNVLKLDVFIDEVKLEEYIGDGILVATSFGSTAYNLSLGGSIIYNTFLSLQITPIAPLNSRSYRSLLHSFIVPTDKKISFIPTRNKNVLLQLDGDNIEFMGVEKIETGMWQKRICCLRTKEYDFSKIINDKFLK